MQHLLAVKFNLATQTVVAAACVRLPQKSEREVPSIKQLFV